MGERPPCGRPRLGATWNGAGVEFVLRTTAATAVDLCLFDGEGKQTARLPLESDRDLWSIRVPGLAPGQLYGYRVDGPYAPGHGHRCNPAKLLVDPWARAVTGDLLWQPCVLGYGDDDPHGTRRNDLDSADSVPKSVVVDSEFDWQGDAPPRTAWEDTVIYEAHVRGLTKLHPEVPPELRGTYLGLSQPPVLEHLLSLGVTAIQLLPVQHFVSERHLAKTGLTNYWGYNPLAWFAPHAGYATGARGLQVAEFKAMVRGLHHAGIEVILDVVYNHTAEGGEEGATLTLRGLDNATYYRSHETDPSRCEDFTGCGNTLDFSRPEVVDLALDSLKYWVEEMHVDGFRFDLATVLGRDPRDFSPDAPLLEQLSHDPAFRNTKLIAEPWDLGPSGYRAGRFPAPWREWNDRYRDTLRRFWRGSSDAGSELAARWSGSADLFADRGPTASINYITAHDGFTLADLVSYSKKHNRANGENDRDGFDHNHSSNCGIEGPTDSPAVLTCRARRQRTFLASLALSTGVPMVGHGDELGRSQGGNNNAYCQDNELTWVDWQLGEERRKLLGFAHRALALRRELDLGRHGLLAEAATWFDAAGKQLDANQLDARASSRAIDTLALCWRLTPNERQASPSSSLLLLIHRGAQPCRFSLPPPSGGQTWSVLLDTSSGVAAESPSVSGYYSIEPGAMALLRNSG